MKRNKATKVVQMKGKEFADVMLNENLSLVTAYMPRLDYADASFFHQKKLIVSGVSVESMEIVVPKGCHVRLVYTEDYCPVNNGQSKLEVVDRKEKSE